MQTSQGNHFYDTPDLKLAAFLHTSGVTFRGLRWQNKDGKRQAWFLFDTPADDILAAWMKGQGEFLDQYQRSRNLLRDMVEAER